MISDRKKLIDTFLNKTVWKNAKRVKFASDASQRNYYRLHSTKASNTILMDAPPEFGENVHKFIKASQFLERIGLSVPKIYNRDIRNGFLILEDFGDDIFTDFLLKSSQDEINFYMSATDNLITLYHAEVDSKAKHYDDCEMLSTSLLSIDWYLKYGSNILTGDLRNQFKVLMREVLSKIMTKPMIMVHRDFHAENLIWLKNRNGKQRVGILDFQDMMPGHPAYDLASLLNDVRRVVNEDVRQKCYDHYVKNTGVDKDAFYYAFCICSAQRNLRILGVFTRLAVRDDKKHYLTFLPQVWKNLLQDLSHPDLIDLRLFIQNIFIAPNKTVLAKIRDSNAN